MRPALFEPEHLARVQFPRLSRSRLPGSSLVGEGEGGEFFVSDDYAMRKWPTASPREISRHSRFASMAA